MSGDQQVHYDSLVTVVLVIHYQIMMRIFSLYKMRNCAFDLVYSIFGRLGGLWFHFFEGCFLFMD